MSRPRGGCGYDAPILLQRRVGRDVTLAADLHGAEHVILRKQASKQNLISSEFLHMEAGESRRECCGCQERVSRSGRRECHVEVGESTTLSRAILENLV